MYYVYDKLCLTRLGLDIDVRKLRKETLMCTLKMKEKSFVLLQDLDINIEKTTIGEVQ